MNNNLSVKLNSLSQSEINYFLKRLTNVLNDRYSCFKYGGMNDMEYASMPKEKVERIKINLYQEMFNNIIPPREIIVNYSASKN